MLFNDRFELVELLGRTAEGVAFRALDPLTDEHVTLHLVADIAVEDFLRRTRSDPQQRVLAHGQYKGHCYIVTGIVPQPETHEITPAAVPPVADSMPGDFTRIFQTPDLSQTSEFSRLFGLDKTISAPIEEPKPAQTAPAAEGKARDPEETPRPIQATSLDVSPVQQPAPPTPLPSGDSLDSNLERAGKFKAISGANKSDQRVGPAVEAGIPGPVEPPVQPKEPPRQSALSDGEFTRVFHPKPSASTMPTKQHEEQWAPKLRWESTDQANGGATDLFAPYSGRKEAAAQPAAPGVGDYTRVIASPRPAAQSSEPASPPELEQAPVATNRGLIATLLGLLILALIIVLYFAFR